MRFPRLMLALVLLLLGGAVLGHIVLLNWVRSLYAEVLAHQVWPEGPQTPIAAQPPRPGAATLLLLGDSRIAEWGLPAIKNSRVINAGVPRITSAQLALRIRRLLEQYQPQIVVVQIGINDFKLLGLRPELRPAVVSACLTNLTHIVRECRRQGARVCVTPVWPPGPVTGLRRFVWSPEVSSGLAEVNRALAQWTPEPDQVRVADLFGDLTRAVAPVALYRDTLHLSPQAYSRLTPLLEQALDPWLTAPQPGAPASTRL